MSNLAEIFVTGETPMARTSALARPLTDREEVRQA